MYSGQLVFSQLMELLPRHEFSKCVARYNGNRRARRFRCWDQFLVMAFAQLTFRESLRDIETCLRAMDVKLYHAGIRGTIARATLADALHEVHSLDELPLEAGSYYVMDRGYVDFARLHRFTREQAFFIVRGKDNLVYRVVESRAVDKSTGLRADQTVRLRGPKTRRFYPEYIRRVSYIDLEHDVHFIFLTNNFHLAASTIAKLYHCRWEVELFFKWIKQHLRIKAFYGTSMNAVQTQLWIAISVYVLVAITKKYLHASQSMGEILQILSLSLFEKTPILQLLDASKRTISESDDRNSLPLLEF